MFVRVKWLALSLLVGLLSPAGATSPSVPGGANGVSALSARLGDTVFNGVLRIKIVALRDGSVPNDSDVTPTAGQKVMYIESLLHNGTHEEFTDLLNYTLADKDAVAVAIPTNALKHANLHILQGAAQRQSESFVVDKDFVPTKLIIQCATCGAHSGFRSVRFTIPPQ